MGRITLSICAVVVAAGLGASAQGPGSGPSREIGTELGHASAGQNAQVAADLGRIASALEAQYTDDDAVREQRDLNAQEGMAWWAKWMFWAAAAQVILNAVGIGLIYVTFRETRRAANSADEIVDVTRLSAEHQLRAYVGPKAAQYTFNVLPNGGSIGVSVEFQNFGQTPAYQYRTALGLARRPYPLTEDPELEASGDTHTLFPSMSSFASLGMPMTPDELLEFQQGQICFVVTAVMEYRDLNYISRNSSVRYLLHASSPNMRSETHTGTLTFRSGASV